MSRSRLTPLGAVVRGAVAGAVGTLAMDLVWYARYRAEGGEDSFAEWEFPTGLSGYEDAPAPAKFGRKLAEGLFSTKLEPHTAAPMTTAVHWATGMGWGTLHGILSGSTRRPRVKHGLLTGPAAWTGSYAVLVPAGLYEPPWHYDAATVWKDLSAHVVFGLATGLAFRVLTLGRSTRR